MSTPKPNRSRVLEELVSRYSRLIRSAVGRVAGPLSESVADDIEQKVLIALWKAMPGEQMPDHPSSYLYRAAVRETVRTMKSRRTEEIGLVEDQRDPMPSPDRLAESNELGALIGQALATLSAERRRAVKAHLMGFDVQEIMTMQRWPYNKARNLIARGMADLRRELVDRGPMSENETLRAAFRESVIGGEGCHLSEDQWERLACDEMTSDERETVLDHIVECPVCTDTYRAVKIIRSEAPAFDAAVPAPPVDQSDATVRRFPFRTFGLLAMAATVVLAVVLPMHFLREPVTDSATVVVRSAGDEVTVVAVSPVGTVVWSKGDDILMEWTVVDDPVPAHVEILDADGELIWTGPEVESDDVTWPGRDIPGPGRYYWRVIVRDSSDGVTDSKLVSFDLSASHP